MFCSPCSTRFLTRSCSISHVELRLPISNVGVRISAVFPRKQRVSALVVHCLRRSSSHLFAGLGLSRGLSPLLKTLSNTLLSLGGTSDVAILHTLFGWNTLRLEHSSAGTFFGWSTLRLGHSSWTLFGWNTLLHISCCFPFPNWDGAKASWLLVSPTPPLPASWLRWRGPQEGGSLAFSSLVGDVHEVSNRFA